MTPPIPATLISANSFKGQGAYDVGTGSEKSVKPLGVTGNGGD